MKPDDVKKALLAAFPDADVHITDLTGTADHYEARIVSAAFEGKAKLAQHRLVYAALGVAMKGEIHALALNTYSPSQWAKHQS